MFVGTGISYGIIGVSYGKCLIRETRVYFEIRKENKAWVM